MKVVIYATRDSGYWFKAPSWEHGRKFELTRGEPLELADADLAELDRQIAEGHPLRYETAAQPADAPVAPSKKGK